MPKLLLLALLLLLGGDGDLLLQAQQAFRAGNYKQALHHYQAALKVYPTLADGIKFNLAQCYLMLDSSARAEALYHEVLNRLPAQQQAIAHNNLGLILAGAKKSKEATVQFRLALVKNPDAENARYNYELLLKRLPKQPPPPPPPPPDNTPPPPPRGRPMPMEGQGVVAQRNQSPQEARAAYEELKKREKSYLQQLQKSNRQRRGYNDGPDW